MFEHELRHRLGRLEERVTALEYAFAAILETEPDSARVVLKGPTMSITSLEVGGTATASIEYFNSADPTTVLPAPDGATATFEDDNPTCASVDGTTGAVVALSAGVANIGTAGATAGGLPCAPVALTVTAAAVVPDQARVVLN